MRTVCRICLRSDFVRSGDIDERLSELHDELCDFDVLQNAALSFCLICEYLLKKFYNFRQKCQQAHRILRTAKHDKRNLWDLQELIPPASIGIMAPSNHQQIYDLVPCNINQYHNLNAHKLVKQSSDQPYEMNIKLENESHHLSTPEELKLDFTEHVLNCKQEYAFPTSCIQVSKLQSCKQERDPINETLCIADDFQSIQNDLKICKEQEFLHKEHCMSNEKYGYNDECSDNDEQTENTPKRNMSHEQNGYNEEFSDNNEQIENTCNTINEQNDYNDDCSDNNEQIECKSKCIKNIKLKPKVKCQKLIELADNISVEEALWKLNKLKKSINKSDKKGVDLQGNILKLKEKVLQILDKGAIDLGDGVTVSRDAFLEMFERCNKRRLRTLRVLQQGPGRTTELKHFLRTLLRRYNPEYQTVFQVQYLTTHAQKVAEFQSRRESLEYQSADIKCELCFKVFQHPNLLEYHNKWHESARPLSCDICPMRFCSRQQVYRHRQHNHFAVYSCRRCPLRTYNFEGMENHYNAHKGAKYKCEVCFGEYKSKSCLNTHRLQHATHPCPLCGRSFVSHQGLRNHTALKHHGETASETVVSCDKCGATFESRDTMHKHARLAHAPRRYKFRCRLPGCAEKFTSGEELREHAIAEGHAQRPLQRPQGPRVFGPHGGRPRATPRKASPARPYRTCPICKAQVANTGGLSLYHHYRDVHPDAAYVTARSTQPKEHLCELCGKTFLIYTHYLDHQNRHTGAKPHACEQCPARFAGRIALYVHSQRHRPPQHHCQDCGKMFRSASNLSNHRRGHIGDRRFKCDICFKGFLHLYTLREHIRGVHNRIRRVRKVPCSKAEDLK